MTHATIPAADRTARGIIEGTLRLSVGIEDVTDLIADLVRASAQLAHIGLVTFMAAYRRTHARETAL